MGFSCYFLRRLELRRGRPETCASVGKTYGVARLEVGGACCTRIEALLRKCLHGERNPFGPAVLTTKRPGLHRDRARLMCRRRTPYPNTGGTKRPRKVLRLRMDKGRWPPKGFEERPPCRRRQGRSCRGRGRKPQIEPCNWSGDQAYVR